MINSAAILGAGFSHAAGLPLAKDLLDSRVFIFSNGADRRFSTVWRAWSEWRDKYPDQGPEQFLTELYLNASGIGTVPWQWAVELVAATLATPRGHDIPVVRNARYAGRISKAVGIEAHERFWDIVLTNTKLLGVLTTNYDILVERGLRHRPIKRRGRPGFYYGGFPIPQILKGLAQPFTVLDSQRLIQLDAGVPVYKLHGSLNWARDNSDIIMYQDLRAAFRRGNDALIVPPVTEKRTPEWLLKVWEEATTTLAKADLWIICGYSLPPYDEALKAFFLRAAQQHNPSKIILLDPFGSSIKSRWQEVSPLSLIECLPGIPQGNPALQSSLAYM